MDPDASRGSMGAQRPRRTLRGSMLGLALLAAACASPSEANRPLYRWTDEAGVVRYTTDPTRIPRRERRDAEVIESVESGATPPVEAPPDETPPSTRPARPSDKLDARIRALEEAIARDEQALKALISSEAGEEGSLAESTELREIARRLPGLQAKLRALLEQRAAPP